MRRETFSSDAPGSLVHISEGVAFIPNPLPPEVLLSRDLLIAVERARGSLGEFVGQARLVSNSELVMAPLRRREAVLSSRIEGTHTEVREVLLAQAQPDARLAQDSDLYEVLNYLRALEYGQEWIAEGRPLNLTLIRGLHEELMRGVRGEDKHPGAFRLTQVYIGNAVSGLSGARFVPPPPEQVSPLIDDLVSFISQGPTYGTLIDCALMHYQFETIHPFEDGNGRLGRLLIPLYLLSAGTLDRPVLYLSSHFESQRDAYMNLLTTVSTKGAWHDWILFFMNAVHSQSEDSRQRVQRILDLQTRYRQLAREASSSRTALLAVDFVMERVYVTVSALAQYAGATYPTARSAIDALVSMGILRLYGRVGGAQIWEAPELLEQIYQ